MDFSIFDNYECDGQISIFDYLEETKMDFYSLINADEDKGKVYCGTCKHFKAEVRKQYGQILGHCQYSKMKIHKACMPRCKKHYEWSGENGVILANNFVDRCEWGTQYGLTEEEKEKMRLRKERKERIRKLGMEEYTNES